MTAPLSPAAYHTRDDLQTLGEQIRDKAIRVTVEYESAQVVGAIHTGHAHDPMVDGSGRIAPDPPITDRTISAWAHGAYDGVPAMFTSFATADPRGIQPMIDALWGVAFALKPEILASLIHSQFDDPIPAGAWKPGTDLTTRVTDIIDTRLRYWHGTASDRFAQDFLNPLRGAVSRQCELAVALAVALTAQQQVTLAAHRDVWDIGHKTLAVLDSLHACTPHDATVALSVVTAAISVILAVPTSGLSVAGLFGLAKAGQHFVTAATASLQLIGGGTVNSVLTSMGNGLAAVRAGADNQEQDIKRYLERIATQISPQDINLPAPISVASIADAGPGVLASQFYAVA